MKKILSFSFFIFVCVPSFTQALTIGPSKAYTIATPNNSNHELALVINFQIAFNSEVTAGQNVVVSGIATREDGLDHRPNRTFTLSSQQTGAINFSPNTFSAVAPSTGSYTLNSGSFVAPSTPGTYTVSFDARETPFYTPPEQMEIRSAQMIPNSAQIVVTAQLPQCSDGIDNEDNDNPSVADRDDPQCWTCPGNPNSYASNHNSETTPPASTCPATLQLNGRPASGPSGFLQVAKKIFASLTTKAFAGE